MDSGSRHLRAADCLAGLWGAGAGLPRTVVREVVRAYAPWVQSWITPETVVRASEIGEIWPLSFWDSMILAAAEQSQAVELLSEDLNHGQVIAGVRVVNPFLPAHLKLGAATGIAADIRDQELACAGLHCRIRQGCNRGPAIYRQYA